MESESKRTRKQYSDRGVPPCTVAVTDSLTTGCGKPSVASGPDGHLCKVHHTMTSILGASWKRVMRFVAEENLPPIQWVREGEHWIRQRKDQTPIYVYVAGPIAKGHPLSNIKEALDVAQSLAEAGHYPFVPISHNLLWGTAHRNDTDFWMEFDFAWLRKADAVFRLHGESVGADREVELAHELSIPVYTNPLDLIHGRKPGETLGHLRGAEIRKVAA